MDIPRELKWIGPIFLILYIILWVKRGPALLISLVLPFAYFLTIWPLQIIGGIILAFVFFVPRYRFTTLITLLSFMWSGIIVEQLPIPYTGPYPPPPVAALFPFILLSPLLSLISLMVNLLSVYPYSMPYIGMVLLVFLAVLTVVAVELVVREKIDRVVAMLSIVLILVSWTFLYVFFLVDFGPYVHLTPVPLSPLVLLNLLPWIKKREPSTSNL